MATQSKLSKRLRKALTSEQPEAELDDDVVEYFAGMLEGDECMSEDELAEAWAPFLSAASPDDPTAFCRAVLRRLQSNSGCSGSSVRSSASSTASPVFSRDISPQVSVRLPAETYDLPTPTDAAEINGLVEWLERLSLSHYIEAAKQWCRESGAAGLEEVVDNWADFSDELGLRYFERRRVERDCEGCVAVAARSPAELAAEELLPDGDNDDVLRELVSDSAGREEGAHMDDSQALALELELGWAEEGETFGPPDNPYTILEELGSGATATVYSCSRGGRNYAVKVIGLRRYHMRGDRAGILQRLHRETSILFSLRHSHIVSLYEVFETPAKLYFVMELVEGGELCNVLLEEGALPEHEARYIFLQILLGLRYIHSKKIAHRDLKPENVLIDREASRPGLREVKITDFGHSKLVQDGLTTGMTRVGTPQFWAPEVADFRTCARGYDQRVDIWSLGVVLYVMLEGRYPEKTQGGVMQFPADTKLSRQAKHLVRALMQQRPEDRLSLDACLRHPWVLTAKGPLNRILGVCEALERSRRGECERIVPLPGDPTDVRQLRCELELLTTRLKRPLTLRHQNGRCEVGVCFSDGLMHEADWDELMSTLERHLSTGTFRRPAISSLESVELGSMLACVPEGMHADDDPSEPGSRLATARGVAASVSDLEAKELAKAAESEWQQNEDQDEDLAVHLRALDAQLESLRVAFPDSVEAIVGDLAPVPRCLDVRLRNESRVLELSMLLPEGYPRHCAAQLGALSLRCPRGQLAEEQLEAQLRALIVARIQSDFLSQEAVVPGDSVSQGPSLKDLVEWLHREISPSLSVPSHLRGAASMPSVTSTNSLASLAGPVDRTSSLASVAGPPDGVKCSRVCLSITSHDELMDNGRGFGATNSKNKSSKGWSSQRESFFSYLKKSCPEVSGLLSFGRPAALIAEGPLDEVEHFLLEVDRFPSWKGHVQQKAFGITELPGASASDVEKWRSFDGFTKVRTEELRQVLERAGQLSLYEQLFPDNAADPRKVEQKKPAKSRLK